MLFEILMRYWYWLSILTPLWNIFDLLLTVQHSCLVRYWSMEWWGSAVWDIDSSVSYCQTLWSPVKYTWLHRSGCAWLNESNPGQGKLDKVGWCLDWILLHFILFCFWENMQERNMSLLRLTVSCCKNAFMYGNLYLYLTNICTFEYMPRRNTYCGQFSGLL